MCEILALITKLNNSTQKASCPSILKLVPEHDTLCQKHNDHNVPHITDGVHSSGYRRLACTCALPCLVPPSSGNASWLSRLSGNLTGSGHSTEFRVPGSDSWRSAINWIFRRCHRNQLGFTVIEKLKKYTGILNIHVNKDFYNVHRMVTWHFQSAWLAAPSVSLKT